MPYKTRYGSHYHMTEGCHGATIPCDTKGLTPCSDCCGKSDGAGGGREGAGSAGMAGGSAATGDGSYRKVAASAADEGGVPASKVVMKADAMAAAGLGGMRSGMRAPGDVSGADVADALARAGAEEKPVSRIGDDTDFALRSSTSDGRATSLRDLVARGHDPKDLYDAIRGCEWSADAMADVLNAHGHMLYAHGWKAVRTAPRHLVVEGKDGFGNTEVLYARLQDDEPDMCEGETLRISLTNKSRVNLAVSNMLSRKCSEARFENVLYDAAAAAWDARAFADAMNRAHADGIVHDRNWRAVSTEDDKCAISGRDAFGNEHTLIIRRRQAQGRD